jgi:hypothetical protein
VWRLIEFGEEGVKVLASEGSIERALRCAMLRIVEAGFS